MAPADLEEKGIKHDFFPHVTRWFSSWLGEPVTIERVCMYDQGERTTTQYEVLVRPSEGFGLPVSSDRAPPEYVFLDPTEPVGRLKVIRHILPRDFARDYGTYEKRTIVYAGALPLWDGGLTSLSRKVMVEHDISASGEILRAQFLKRPFLYLQSTCTPATFAYKPRPAEQHKP